MLPSPTSRLCLELKSLTQLCRSPSQYWQTDLWTRLFDLLLNPRLSTPSGALPVSDALRALRVEMADQLVDKCTKGGKNLKQLLKKLEREYGGF